MVSDGLVDDGIFETTSTWTSISISSSSLVERAGSVVDNGNLILLIFGAVFVVSGGYTKMLLIVAVDVWV